MILPSRTKWRRSHYLFGAFAVLERILTLLPATVNCRKVYIICVSATDPIWQCFNSHALLSRSYFFHKLTLTSFHPVCVSPHITPFTEQYSSLFISLYLGDHGGQTHLQSSQYKEMKRSQIWILDLIREGSSLGCRLRLFPGQKTTTWCFLRSIFMTVATVSLLAVQLVGVPGEIWTTRRKKS